jgi:hypothetical protein
MRSHCDGRRPASLLAFAADKDPICIPSSRELEETNVVPKDGKRLVRPQQATNESTCMHLLLAIMKTS